MSIFTVDGDAHPVCDLRSYFRGLDYPFSPPRQAPRQVWVLAPDVTPLPPPDFGWRIEGWPLSAPVRNTVRRAKNETDALMGSLLPDSTWRMIDGRQPFWGRSLYLVTPRLSILSATPQVGVLRPPAWYVLIQEDGTQVIGVPPIIWSAAHEGRLVRL